MGGDPRGARSLLIPILPSRLKLYVLERSKLGGLGVYLCLSLLLNSDVHHYAWQ